jgi:hypothetical protein
VSYINEDADVREVCEGTNKKNDRNIISTANAIFGDLHGQAPILWCATAFVKIK